jgi:hypothetical protein
MTGARIFVVAGPRSCGKTAFIERCREKSSARILTDELSGMTTARSPIFFMDLAGVNASSSTDLLVHVDLVTPFTELLVASEQELRERLEPAASTPGLHCFASARSSRC